MAPRCVWYLFLTFLASSLSCFLASSLPRFFASSLETGGNSVRNPKQDLSAAECVRSELLGSRRAVSF